MTYRVAFWLALAITAVAFAVALGCASLAEQDTQRRVAIDHEIRLGRLERTVYEPVPPERQAYHGDGK